MQEVTVVILSTYWLRERAPMLTLYLQCLSFWTLNHTLHEKKTITLQTAKVYHCLRLEWLSGRCRSEFEDHIMLVTYVQNFVTSKKDIEIL